VKKGFIVLAIDPIGQGERLQYFDPVEQKSLLGGSTKEHSYPSIQVFLLGQSIARYWIRDGIRSIDYLLSREEVDPDRIGVQGLSGGGTQTAYISAMDNRVLASAPACYITNFRRLMESRGLQDGEQNFYHGMARGLDHADFFVTRAPKPSLIMATTRDIFSIQGVYETYSEAKRVYGILGNPDHMQMVEDEWEHGYTRKTREAMYAFFQKYLHNPGPSAEEEVEYVPEEELQKTPTGQLSTSLGGETVFSLNLKESEKHTDRLEKSRKDMDSHLPQVILSAKKLSGYRNPPPPETPVFTGRFQKENYVIEKYFVKGEGNYVIPYLLFKPEKRNHKAVIYLHPEGKSAGADPGGEIEWFVKHGFIVLSPDLLGTGELGNGAFKGDAYISHVSYNKWYTAMQIGRSIVGIHAADVITLSRLLDQNESIHEVYGVARGAHAPVLLHAAAFDPVISRIGLLSPYISYRSVVSNRFYKPDFIFSMVPGALTGYDLPDLAATLAPNNLIMAGITDANGDQIHGESLNREIEIIKEGYRHMNAGNQLVILPPESLTNPDILFGGWIE